MIGCANILCQREHQRWKVRWSEAISQIEEEFQNMEIACLPDRQGFAASAQFHDDAYKDADHCLLLTFRAIQSFDFGKKMILYDLSPKWVIIKVN